MMAMSGGYLRLKLSMYCPSCFEFNSVESVENQFPRMGPPVEIVVPIGLKPALLTLIVGKARNRSVVPIGVPQNPHPGQLPHLSSLHQ